MRIWAELRSLITVTLLVGRTVYWKRPGPLLYATTGIKGHCNSIKTVTIAELIDLLDASYRHGSSQCKLVFKIEDCSILAAPVLMFFLKRRGYSFSKAWKSAKGLIISTSR